MNFEDFKVMLLEDIESMANWRVEIAAEYPEDTRNARSACALKSLAENLRQTRADHPAIRHYWRILHGLRRPGEIDSSEIIEYIVGVLPTMLKYYGFHHPEDGGLEEFLDRLIADLEGHVAAAS